MILEFKASNGCEFSLMVLDDVIDITNDTEGEGFRLPLADLPRFIHELQIIKAAGL
jgi:hypothetical protein